jgi:hypothetical protein
VEIKEIVAEAICAVDTTPPELGALSAKPSPFSPDGDGIAENVSISYSLMEPLAPLSRQRGNPGHGKPCGQASL